VSYAYPDGIRALEEVDLAIGSGERVALVGPNGAGKSTLLHILAGLYLPTSGKVEIMGKELTKKSAEEVRRPVGFLFQDPDDQIFMPRVWDDVAFGPINMKLDPAEVRVRVEEALGLAGIDAYADRVPHHLSFGEKKRVAIAGVLAMKPKILLLDEPTANLDPQGRRDLVKILDSLNNTILLATHDLSVAFELTDRVIVLKKSIVFDGDFSSLIEDRSVLSQANLDLPSLPRLMAAWRERKGRSFSLPLTVDDALAIMERECP